MAESRFFLFRGTDEYALQKKAKAFLNVFSDPTSAQMNSSWLDMAKTELNAVRENAYAMPFLAEQRLVVLENGLHPFQGNIGKSTVEAYHSKMIALLNDLPDWTKIAIIQLEEIPTWKKDDKDDTRFEWLLKWKNAAGESFAVEKAMLPVDEGSKRNWLAQTSKAHGLTLQPGAIDTLLAFSGDFDPRMVETELEKLGAYVNYSRPVTSEDIKAICISAEAFRIFDLTDAIANKDLTKAIHIFRSMEVESDVQQEIFPMVVRQYRLLLQAAYLREKLGRAVDVSKIGGLANPYVAKKTSEQAQRYSYRSLRNMYTALLDLDLAMKLSKVDPATGVELFIVESADVGEFTDRPILEPKPVTSVI